MQGEVGWRGRGGKQVFDELGKWRGGGYIYGGWLVFCRFSI
jgi:hypothetical protein